MKAGEGGREPETHRFFLVYLPLMLGGGEEERVDLSAWTVIGTMLA